MRLAFMLGLAILPIGLIAIYQTTQFSQVANRNTELALLALSDQAVQAERLVIQRATGAAMMLGGLAPTLIAEPDQCVPTLTAFLDRDPNLSFVGILPLDGVMTCSSVPDTLDFSGYDTWPDLVANPRPSVVMNPAAPGSQTAVIVVSMPFKTDGQFSGYVSVSIPQQKLSEQDAFADLPVSDLVDLYTFNDRGALLTAENDLEAAARLLPEGIDTVSLANDGARSFSAQSRSGDEYVYTVVPMSDSALTIVGVWEADREMAIGLMDSVVPAATFPVLMWIVSVLVAVMALHTMVTRYISTLRKQMDGFTTDRIVPKGGFDGNAPNELIEIQAHFLDMTDDILREEAHLEALVHEQKVLAKEVHHRVKNNLQMIASIMNMQIRNAEHDETVDTLHKVQDRIAALAEVHKDLYITQNEGRVNVGALIARTVQSSIEVALPDVDSVAVTKEIEDVWLFPDQVVPLSLLASEAITNALKYLDAPQGEKPKLDISLRRLGDACQLRVSNTTHGATEHGTGIGSKLIRAFGIKLGAEMKSTDDEGHFVLEALFPIAEFELQSVDF